MCLDCDKPNPTSHDATAASGQTGAAVAAGNIDSMLLHRVIFFMRRNHLKLSALVRAAAAAFDRDVIGPDAKAARARLQEMLAYCWPE